MLIYLLISSESIESVYYNNNKNYYYYLPFKVKKN